MPGSPFEAFDVVKVPRWHEVGLWWPAERLLVVPETVGTGPMYRHGDVPAGAGAQTTEDLLNKDRNTENVTTQGMGEAEMDRIASERLKTRAGTAPTRTSVIRGT